MISALIEGKDKYMKEIFLLYLCMSTRWHRNMCLDATGVAIERGTLVTTVNHHFVLPFRTKVQNQDSRGYSAGSPADQPLRCRS